MSNIWKIVSPKPSLQEMRRLFSLDNKFLCLKRLKEIFAIWSKKLGNNINSVGIGFAKLNKNVKKTALQSQLQLIVQYKIDAPFYKDLGTSRLEGLRSCSNKWIVEF